MMPTLKIGQKVTVSLDAHYVPKVGDIIVFHPPAGADAPLAVCADKAEGAGHKQACDAQTAKESSLTFIKRVVAGSGDTIKIINGNVYRNGQRESDSSYTEACGGGPYCSYPSPITIPARDYFVLGDNRGESDDSRFWGPAPKAWIIGKVVQP
jgi:signal peptidase I